MSAQLPFINSQIIGLRPIGFLAFLIFDSNQMVLLDNYLISNYHRY